jgi:hypothetical protein
VIKLKNKDVRLIIKESKYIYNIGDIVDNLKNGKLKIVDQIKMSQGKANIRGYKYECLTCGNIHSIRENNLKNKNGCNVCSSQKVKVGINDIWTTSYDFGKLLWNPEDGYKFTSGARAKVDFKCPNCGERIESKKIGAIKINGLSCVRCSDGVSYPEKFIFHFLKSLNITFEKEYSPEWAFEEGNPNSKLNGRKYYDFSTDLFTIEVHGEQHYKKSGRGRRTLKDEIENDFIKKKLHDRNEKNKIYVVIDARISIMEQLRDQLLDSKLKGIVDMTDIDWLSIDRDSQKSYIRVTCDYYNSGKSVKEIEVLLNSHNVTVVRYLKRGSSIGWCTYDPKKASLVGSLKNNNGVPIVRLNLNGEYIDEFISIRDAENKLKISGVGLVCSNKYKNKSAGGYKWLYKKDYNKLSIKKIN